MVKMSSPPIHKLLARCHFFPGCSALFKLISFTSLPSCRLQCLDSKSWRLVPRCRWSSLPWEGDLCSGCCHCEHSPIGGDSWLPTQVSLWSVHTPKWLQDCRQWLLYLQNAPACTSEQNSLSHQWTRMSLKPIFFNMRDYSSSYFLAFLLL